MRLPTGSHHGHFSPSESLKAHSTCQGDHEVTHLSDVVILMEGGRLGLPKFRENP